MNSPFLVRLNAPLKHTQCINLLLLFRLPANARHKIAANATDSRLPALFHFKRKRTKSQHTPSTCACCEHVQLPYYSNGIATTTYEILRTMKRYPLSAAIDSLNMIHIVSRILDLVFSGGLMVLRSYDTLTLIQPASLF